MEKLTVDIIKQISVIGEKVDSLKQNFNEFKEEIRANNVSRVEFEVFKEKVNPYLRVSTWVTVVIVGIFLTAVTTTLLKHLFNF